MDVSFPFHPEHVPLKSAFLSGSDHTSIVSEEEVEVIAAFNLGRPI